MPGAEFYYPTAAAPQAFWLPEFAPALGSPESIDYPFQLVGQTAGGTRYVQDKGIERRTFNLKFSHISQDDRDGLEDFFRTVKKAFSTFEYIDARGNAYTVRWMNEFNFMPDQPDTPARSGDVYFFRYSGNIQLEVQP